MTNLTNGNDLYNGTEGDDIVNGRGGDDIINGLGGDDQINGGSGNDTIDGGQGDDQISGGSDNDILTGGLGNDILIGGSGDDTAIINADGANGIGSHNGGTLTVTTVDGQDELTGIEHIQFNNGTVDIVNGNANAFLGADTLSVNEGSPPPVVPNNVLNNDFDIDDTMTITGFHNSNNDAGTLGSGLHGAYGTLTLASDGTYSYVADSSTNSLGVGESDVDTFTYTVHSGNSDFTQTITVTIVGQNDDPVFTSSGTSITYTDTQNNDIGSITTATGTLTASDADTNDHLTFGISGGSADISNPGFDISSSSPYGTLYVNSETGAYAFVPDDAAIEALKTTVDYSFNFTVTDGHGSPVLQEIDFHFDGVNDTPTLGVIASATYNDTSASDDFVTTTGTLNGADRDNDQLTYHATSEASGGVGSFDMHVDGAYGTLYFNSETGAYEYVPDGEAIEALKTTSSDTFSFTATDGALTSVGQTLTITVNGVNDTPDIVVNSPSNQLTEAGGVGNAISGTAQASATTSLSDRDSGDTPTFDTTALATALWTNDGGGIWHLHGTYGTASLDTGTGIVTYTLDNNDTDTQGLQDGQTVHDIFTLPITDGSLTNTGTVDFTINGTNDAAVISGTVSGSATEASGANNGTAGSNATGTATDSDVDNATNSFQAVGTPQFSDNGYGTWTVDAGGHWVFNVVESDPTVQALNVGQSLSDTFTIHSADGTAQTITVTINGANDAAVVTGVTTGSVTESGSTGPATSGTANGTLDNTDVDNASHLFQVVSNPTPSDHAYGSYEIDCSGNWSFALDNGNTTIQALNDGDVITETFTVHTLDGTAQTITITINGANEQFSGTAGNNLMLGTVWGDTFTGGDGNDTYRINNTHDKIVELTDQGYDTAQTSVSYTLDANVEALVMSAHTNIDGTGNALDNSMIGNSGSNVLSGLGGDDVLQGGGGNDTLIGGDGDDNMNGGTGSDTASYASASGAVHVSLAATTYQDTGSAGTDKLVSIENLVGSGFDDTLTGSSASGAAGNNSITGGLGADTMTGGLGHDTFIYTSVNDSTVAHSDLITDLQNNVDFIDLSALGNDFAIVNHFTNHADQITLHYDSGTLTTTISIDTNGDGVADMQILATGDHHTFNDFIGLGIA